MAALKEKGQQLLKSYGCPTLVRTWVPRLREEVVMWMPFSVLIRTAAYLE